MPTVAELDVVISADTRQFDVGVKHVEDSAKGLGESVSKGVGVGLGFGAVSKGLELLGGAFDAIKGSAIDLNSSLEQSKIAFTTMLGSEQAAQSHLDALAKFAAQTPFEFPDLVMASKRLLAMGFAAKDQIPLLTAVGDAVAAVGGGKEMIDGVTLALGQMNAKGKVSAEEMNQLAERGIPAWDMLAKKLGVSVADAMDMASKGQVKAVTFIEAFQEGTAQRFGGMMAKQSRTWQGALSNISDTVQMTIARAFKPLFDVMSTGALMLADFLGSEQFKGWADAVVDALGSVIDQTLALGQTIVTALQPAFEWVMAHGDDIKSVFLGAAAAIGALVASQAVIPIIAAVGSALTALLSPIALVAAAGAALALAWQHNWFDIQSYTQSFLTWLQNVAIPFLTATLGAAIGYLTTTVVPLFQAALVAVQTWMSTVLMPTLASLWDWLSPKLGAVLTWLTETAWPALGNAMNAVQNWINETLVPALTSAWSWLQEKMGDALTWLKDTGWPAFQTAMTAVWTWITETLIPTLSDVFDWLAPKFQQALNWLVLTGWPAFQTAMTAVQQWIDSTLVPSLKTVWDWLSTNFQTALNWLVETGWPSLLGAMTSVADYITQTTIPAFQNLHHELEQKGAYDDIWVGLVNIYTALEQVTPDLESAGSAFNSATQPARDFASAIKSITAAFREWSEYGPYELVDALNDAIYQIQYTIYRGMKAIAESAKWVANAMGKDLPDWVASIPDEPQRPGKVQRPGGGGDGGGPNQPSPPATAPPPPPPTPPPSAPAPTPSPAPPSPPPAAPNPSPGGVAGVPSVGGEVLGGGDIVENYIRATARNLGIDPSTAVAVANTEGGARDYMRIGRFNTGWSFWPFQLHYGGAGTPWATWGNTAGMGNDFTRKSGWQPGDWHAWMASTEYALGIARDDGWRQWYGAAAGGISRWQGIPGHYAGGWVGLNGPELGVLGERGPEYIIPHDVIQSQRPGAIQTLRVDVAIGGRLAEQIYIRGRDLAIQRGRDS